MFSALSKGYNSLQQAAQASTIPQSATATIDRLCDRLLNGTQLEDRRAALLGIKGLSRDWKADVGSRALPILLGVLEEDAKDDVEMAKAVVETMSLLCEVEEVDGRPVRDDSGVRNTDVFLATPTALHTLLTLLTPMHFYLRFFTLQLLGILLANRPAQVQQYVLTAPGGVGRLVETLDDTREIIRNESLLLIIALTTQNADIQKLLAFEGAFDKLFTIVRNEGGIGSGGIVVQDCLAAVGGLLRWNVSNQNYFRETSSIPILAPLLLFPRVNALNPQSLATFAFQSWSEQKVINAGLVISLVRMLVGGAGSGRSSNQKALLQTGLTRCLIELALASNAPAVLKSQSLNALADILRLSSDNQSLLTSLIVTPLVPPLTPSSPETYNEDSANPDHPDYDPYAAEDQQHQHHEHGHDHDEHEQSSSTNNWRRGEPVPAVVAVVNLAVNGDGTPGREGLRVRASAASLFENYVAAANETQLHLLSTMATPQPDSLDDQGHRTDSAGSILLRALRTFPSPTRNESFDSYVPFFACLLFSHLLFHSETSKAVARKIYFQGDSIEPGGEGDEDDRASLVAVLVGNLMMAQREQAQSQNAGLRPERALEWSRVMIGYLTVLSVWLWESPATVKEFLSEGSNLQVLLQPVTQSSGVDSVVQGLCAFLLGICYEYNREPGPITREMLHPILQSRVGADQFVSRILRLREDPRFRNVGPTVLELIDEDDASADDLGEEEGLWFDFGFVEFLKTNYISVQRAILVDPHATTSVTRSVALPGSSEMLITLRDTIETQGRELDELRELVHQLQQERDEERNTFQHEVASLSDTIVTMRTQYRALQAEKEEADTEQEDLLVLLEDLSQKRKGDKRKLREKGVEVSEDEDGDEDGEEVEEELENAGAVNGDEQPQEDIVEDAPQGEAESVRSSTPPPASTPSLPPVPSVAPPASVAPPPASIASAPASVAPPAPLPPIAIPSSQPPTFTRRVLISPVIEVQPESRTSTPSTVPPPPKAKPRGGGADDPSPRPYSPFVASVPPPPKKTGPPRPIYAPFGSQPPTAEDMYAPSPPSIKQEVHDPYAPPPKAGQEAHDPYAPPPKVKEAMNDPYGPSPQVKEESASHEPEPAKEEPKEVEREEAELEEPEVDSVEPQEELSDEQQDEQPRDPFASVGSQQPPRDPFAPPQQQQQQDRQPAHDPFASAPSTRHDPFAPAITHDRQPSHDPFAPPPSSRPYDPFASSSSAHGPFAPSTSKNGLHQQHDRAPSNPFSLSASSRQDDPYSPFGGSQGNNDPFSFASPPPSSTNSHYNPDPFGLSSSAQSLASSRVASPFDPPKSHVSKTSVRDVSDLFR
ncbi:hypothetical protein JCM11641_007976 [Rhodosporidiobolus odoratus]